MAEHRVRTTTAGAGLRPPSRVFPWLVFGLSFALLLSDFMCRQVLAPIFPLLEAQWSLTDTQLGALAALVPVAVAVFTVPLSLLADRFGRRRAILAMAGVWSLATLGAALATGYGQLLVSRFVLGVGEAAYGSVGLAVVLTVFPEEWRASLSGAFQAGGSFGSALGVAVGGLLAVRLGWRWSVGLMALLGVVLAALFRQLVSAERLAGYEPRAGSAAIGVRRALSRLLSAPASLCAYAGGGLQLFVAGSLLAWLPTYLHRTQGLPTGRAAAVAAVLLLVMACGMVACGLLADRLARTRRSRLWAVAMVYAAVSAVVLGIGFRWPAWPATAWILGLGAFFAAGTTGPVAALVAGLTDPASRAGGLGMLALANNLLGLAAGPFVVGLLADRLGLAGAMGLVPVVSAGVIAVLALGRHVGAGSGRVAAAGGPG